MNDFKQEQAECVERAKNAKNGIFAVVLNWTLNRHSVKRVSNDNNPNLPDDYYYNSDGGDERIIAVYENGKERKARGVKHTNRIIFD